VQQRQPAAAELLSLCAFLTPNAIPEELLTQGAEHLGPTIGRVAADPSLLNQALSVLLSASLITRDPVESTLFVHRLVQAVLRDAMSPEETQQWAGRAVLATNAAFPDVAFATWPACKRCLPHAQACFSLIEQDLVATLEAALLLNKLGSYLDDRGQYEEAEAPLRRALLIREAQLRSEHPHTVNSLNNLAGFYTEHGRYEQAELLYQRALAIYEQRLGLQHPRTLNVRGYYVRLLRKLGRNEEAARVEARGAGV
jgi:tetratricopeptide (TPR) repeat protein